MFFDDLSNIEKLSSIIPTFLFFYVAVVAFLILSQFNRIKKINRIKESLLQLHWRRGATVNNEISLFF